MLCVNDYYVPHQTTIFLTLFTSSSTDDDSTTVPKYQHLEEVSLDEFEFNLNSEAGSVDLDGDHLQAIENVSPNSPQHLLDDNALSVAMCLTTNCGDTIPNWVNVGV